MLRILGYVNSIYVGVADGLQVAAHWQTPQTCSSFREPFSCSSSLTTTSQNFFFELALDYTYASRRDRSETIDRFLLLSLSCDDAKFKLQ
jgi:hypothetical protein